METNNTVKKPVPVLNEKPALAEFNGEPESATKDPQIRTLKDFDQWRITKERDIPQPEPAITIGGAAYAITGNMSAISAASKAGKTALKAVMEAGAISMTGDIDGFNDIEVLPNPEGKAVIDMDTEQSEADQQYLVNTILRRAHFESTPDYYRAYNIRQLTIDNYRKITDCICELSDKAFGGVHMIFIDGGADYIKSVNDEAQAHDIVEYYIHLSIKYNCPVIVIVHLNPGSDKERGHFGSEVQRRCYGLLTIIKDNDISTVQPKIMRKAGNRDVPLICFTYSKEKGYHIEVNAEDRIDQKAIKEMERLKQIAEIVFAPPTSLTHTNAVNKIMQHTHRKLSTAKTMLKNMEGFGFIEDGIDKNYRLVMPGKSTNNE